MQSHNARLGLVLFGIYSAFYCVFMFVNAFSASTMELRPIAGVNLAILSGFGLIILALVLALVYGVMAKPDAETDAKGDKS